MSMAKKIGPGISLTRGMRGVSARRPQASGVETGEARFTEVLNLIEVARGRAYQAVNAELVGLYWQLGEYISKKIAAAEWGDGVVEDLANTLARRYPGIRGYTRSNLFRMRQFYEAYQGVQKVAPLVRQLPGPTTYSSSAKPSTLMSANSTCLRRSERVGRSGTMLPPKAVLRRKLHELYTELATDMPATTSERA
jgi:hypothetical protein